jgi:hypothetical protein
MSRNYIIAYRRKRKSNRKLFPKGKSPKTIVKRLQQDNGVPYSKRFQRARKDDSRAKIVAEQITGSKHVKVKRMPISRALKKRVEQDLGAKMNLKPKLYVYEPKKGHSFWRKKRLGAELGVTYMPINVHVEEGRGELHLPDDPYILIPKSHFKDRKVADTVTLHELAETLALQEIYKEAYNNPTSHERALEVEKRFEKKHGMTRDDLLKQAEDLYKKKESWN